MANDIETKAVALPALGGLSFHNSLIHFDRAIDLAAVDISTRPKPAKTQFRRMASKLALNHRHLAREEGNRAATVSVIGATVGGGLLTGALVSALTTPLSFPILLAIAAAGGIVLMAGLVAAHILNGRKNDQEYVAEQYDWLAAEIGK